MNALAVVAVAYAIGVAAACWVVGYHDRLARERDRQEHERWAARQQEAEAVLIRDKARWLDLHQQLSELQVRTASRIHDALHPEDDEPWKRA